MKKLYLSVAVAALTASLIAIPANALDVGVGSSSGGGTTGSASEGNTSGTATIGGGGGNVARGVVGTGGNNATFSIGNTSGPLVSGSSTGSPVDNTSTSNAAVNLGALGGLLGSIPGGGGGGVTPGAVATAVSGLSGAQMAQLKLTCNSVLGAPARYDAGIVQLCQLLVTL